MVGNDDLDEEEIEKLKLRKLQELMRANTQTKPQKAAAPAKPAMLELTDLNFEEALRTNRLLVVDFWAPWCGPCRIVSPIIEELASEYAGKLGFGKLNVDNNPATAQTYGIQGIPTIMFFRDGAPVDAIVGAAPKAYISSKIEQLLQASAET